MRSAGAGMTRLHIFLVLHLLLAATASKDLLPTGLERKGPTHGLTRAPVMLQTSASRSLAANDSAWVDVGRGWCRTQSCEEPGYWEAKEIIRSWEDCRSLVEDSYICSGEVWVTEIWCKRQCANFSWCQGYHFSSDAVSCRLYLAPGTSPTMPSRGGPDGTYNIQWEDRTNTGCGTACASTISQADIGDDWWLTESCFAKGPAVPPADYSCVTTTTPTTTRTFTEWTMSAGWVDLGEGDCRTASGAQPGYFMANEDSPFGLCNPNSFTCTRNGDYEFISQAWCEHACDEFSWCQGYSWSPWGTASTCYLYFAVGENPEKPADMNVGPYEFRWLGHDAYSSGQSCGVACAEPISRADAAVKKTFGATYSCYIKDRFEPVEGDGSNQACRGQAPSDNSASYFTVVEGQETLEACKTACMAWGTHCAGVEYAKGRCEVWTRAEGIGAVFDLAGHTCLRYLQPLPPLTTSTAPVPADQFVPVAGDGTDQVCRGATTSDNSASYYKVFPQIHCPSMPASCQVACKEKALDACKAACRTMPEDCKGIEYHPSGHCEVWTRLAGIGTTKSIADYTCLRYTGAAMP
eukprot:TRINITY_DN51149_c0_g1_i1.p1 TRINITY_DN51149_c0_g1~~TRINITY_DN51149_c0_g1_i1.p1  ORF type:complete len:578 (-),score=42.96 TRINITY_DN51149_c0_g1_i1:46-1779(-)